MAMSGGVDSAVAAARLLNEGYEVVGVTMRLSKDVRSVDETRDCGSDRAAADARRVADIFGFPHYIVDFRALFHARVVEYFLNTYAAGRTPNPCVVCNRYLKFSGLWEKAREMGADFLATGHYARLQWDDALRRHRLLKGRDAKKDQSYVLYHIAPEMLPRLLFPLGEFTKSEVRAMAEKLGLPVAKKAESQEICFIDDDDYGRFLRENRPDCLRPGNIVDQSGKVLGRHEGAPLYTIGQRRGLGVAAPTPLYVTGLDIAHNRVIVGTAEEVFASSLTAGDLNWLTGKPLTSPRRVEAKIRYGVRTGWAVVSPQGENRVTVCFEKPQRAITPGQSVVFYDGDEVLGGGTIESASAGKISP